MRKTRKKHVLVSLSVLALIIVAFLSGRYSVQSIVGISNNATSSDEASTWEVKEEKIGHAVTMEVFLTRSPLPAPEIYKEGVVTSCDVSTNTSVMEGSKVAGINLSPIIAGQGTIPAFRDLEEGMNGEDVTQLRDFLCRQGYPVCATNSTFTPALTNAVKQWQKKMDVEATGIVKAGDIMWFSTLPVTLSPESTCTVGTNVENTAHLFRLTSSTPTMYLGATQEQTNLFSPGNTVLFESGEKGILGEFTAQQKANEDVSQEATATYTAPILSEDSSQEFCALNTDFCNEILGNRDKESVIVKIENMVEEHGIGVPVMAIQINARGNTYVIDETGKEISVTVLNSDSSIALVEGIKVGTVIKLHGETRDK